MKIAVVPAPNGIPAIMGAIQCTFGVHVHAKMISPSGTQREAIQTTETMASGGTFPVTSSRLCELISLRINGSRAIVIKDPIPIPQ